MTKGNLGVEIRHRLMFDQIISLKGNKYFSDAGKLGEIVGATYQDLKFKPFDERVRKYVSSIASTKLV
jgi:hypothetical protein